MRMHEFGIASGVHSQPECNAEVGNRKQGTGSSSSSSKEQTENSQQTRQANPTAATAAVSFSFSGKAAKERDPYGRTDGFYTVGEALKRTVDPGMLSVTPRQPDGIILPAWARYTKQNPATGAELRMAEAYEKAVNRYCEKVFHDFMHEPYYGMRTRAAILWNVANVWRMLNEHPISKAYPAWFPAIRELRRLALLEPQTYHNATDPG